MRVEDLNASELLELDPEGGVIRFAGQRALLVDAMALGLLRKFLAASLGLAAARAVLTQFGFAHGWQMAESVRAQFPWDGPLDWRLAGTRLQTLEGLFTVRVPGCDPLAPEGSLLDQSYEAEQHLAHFGIADAPVCWTICGLLSGYLSKTEGTETFVLEDRCVARGDESCHLIARSRKQWVGERDDDIQFYSREQLRACLDVSLEKVVATLEDAEDRPRAPTYVVQTPAALRPPSLSAKSASMRELIQMVDRVAGVDTTLLISGESGVGKERIARLVHDESGRAEGPFVAVNCGAITETLLESELFGHVKGAFTGASQARPGLFETASRGTLLLDEIGDVSSGMQSKLLRVLQERELRRVGDDQTRPVDVRVLAASNKDLGKLVADGTFRQDLFYRLNVIQLHVPPLRERREDILPIARALLHESATRMRRNVTGLSPAAAHQLLRFDWPGNVRELENVMERAVALATGSRIQLEDLPEQVRRVRLSIVPSRDDVLPLKRITREYILAVLELNEGNQALTARQLEIGTATLYRKLRSYEAADLAAKSPPP